MGIKYTFYILRNKKLNYWNMEENVKQDPEMEVKQNPEVEVKQIPVSDAWDSVDDELKSEIVLGLVAPIGVNLKRFEELFRNVLTNYRYELNLVKLSTFLKSGDGTKLSAEEIDNSSEYNRYKTLMDGK